MSIDGIHKVVLKSFEQWYVLYSCSGLSLKRQDLFYKNIPEYREGFNSHSKLSYLFSLYSELDLLLLLFIVFVCFQL